MKIKGIHSGKQPGTRRGDPMLLSDNELAKAAVFDAMSAKNTKEKLFLTESVDLAGVTANARRDIRTREARTFAANGSLVYREQAVDNARTTAKKTAKFQIKFVDKPDDMGQPDIKVTEFSLL